MTRAVKVKCPECGEVNEQAIDQMLVDLVDDHNVLLYTCDECGEFVTKPVSEKSLLALREVGVFTVDEMSAWIVGELEREKGK